MTVLVRERLKFFFNNIYNIINLCSDILLVLSMLFRYLGVAKVTLMQHRLYVKVNDDSFNWCSLPQLLAGCLFCLQTLAVLNHFSDESAWIELELNPNLTTEFLHQLDAGLLKNTMIKM